MSTLDRQLTQRNGSQPDQVTLLREHHAAKLDVVIPSAGLRSAGGRWQIDGTGAAVLGPDGVTTSPGTLTPTGTCDAGMADKLGIPVGYRAGSARSTSACTTPTSTAGWSISRAGGC
jgi:hypothetical protein